jgi:hypothetical protein
MAFWLALWGLCRFPPSILQLLSFIMLVDANAIRTPQAAAVTSISIPQITATPNLQHLDARATSPVNGDGEVAEIYLQHC